MKKILTFMAIAIASVGFGQTIDIGPNQYAFQFTNNPNFGLFFNANEAQYEFRDGSANPIFAIRSSNGRLVTDLEMDSGVDYIVPNNRYAFRAKSDPDFGLFFNANDLSYDFRNSLGEQVFKLRANSGNLSTVGYIKPGNTNEVTEGIIRFNGGDLEGRVDGQWKSLTSTDGGTGTLQDAFDNGNTIAADGIPLSVTGSSGILISQGSPGSFSGPGRKMFFNPANGVFRAGNAGGGLWDANQQGSNSAAFGSFTQASGGSSFAAGDGSEATGAFSTAFGDSNSSTGEASFAAGTGSTAEGDASAVFGENNVATGSTSFAAGEDNIASGFGSTVFGRNSVASGTNSIAVGNNAEASGSVSVSLGSSTNASGSSSASLGFNTDAEAFGSLAGGITSLASGDGSMAFGRGAIARSGGEIALGSFNTDYSPDNPTSWFATDRLFVIGNGSGSGDRSNALVMLKNGNMGLGTDDPTSRLTIEDPTSSDIGLRMRGGDNFVGWDSWRIGQAQTNNAFVFNFGSTTRYRMSSSGFTPGTDNFSALGSASERFTQVFAVNGTINTSDAREKKNIKRLDYGLETLMELQPVSYEWKDDPMNQGTKLGFVAQDLLEVVPEVVVTEERVEDRETGAVSFKEAERMGVYYDDLIPVLTKAIQEQQGIIEEVTEENAELKEQLKRVLDRMDYFEQDLQTCCFSSQSNVQTRSTHTSAESAELGQNIPNPFSESTVIRYYLPEGAANAIIRITDMEGSPVEDIRLGEQKGANQVEFQTQSLASGTYLYSLFVDGKFVDTKKMMIAK